MVTVHAEYPIYSESQKRVQTKKRKKRNPHNIVNENSFLSIFFSFFLFLFYPTLLFSLRILPSIAEFPVSVIFFSGVANSVRRSRQPRHLKSWRILVKGMDDFYDSLHAEILRGFAGSIKFCSHAEECRLGLHVAVIPYLFLSFYVFPIRLNDRVTSNNVGTFR